MWPSQDKVWGPLTNTLMRHSYANNTISFINMVLSLTHSCSQNRSNPPPLLRSTNHRHAPQPAYTHCLTVIDRERGLTTDPSKYKAPFTGSLHYSGFSEINDGKKKFSPVWVGSLLVTLDPRCAI